MVGSYTPSDALQHLLAGSGVTATAQPGGGFTLAAVTSPTQLGAAEYDSGAEEEIVVTGTNIRAIQEGPSPVDVYDREDIARTGATNVQEFFRSVPQNFSGGSNSTNLLAINEDGADSETNSLGTTLNLRGLGTGTTLTLLNGRRLVAGDTSNFVDISMIPLSAIDRIEILTDGASAIYGSDAIGGVVNLIVRTDYDGAETAAQYSFLTEGDAPTVRASQTLGNAWNSGYALLSYEYFSQEALDASEKDFAADAPFTPFELAPETTRHSLFGSLSQELTPTFALSADGFYSRRNTTWNSASDDFSGGSQLQTFDPEVRQYGGNVAGRLSLGNDWEGRVTLGLSRTTTDGTIEVTAFGATTELERSTTSELRSLDLVADGPALSLPGGELRIAVGASFREENLEDESTGFSNLTTARDVHSGFVEALIPFFGERNRTPGLYRLDFTAAVRYDEYSDFGSTVNPKFGIVWQPSEPLTFRATYGTSFRAPTLYDTSTRSTSVFGINVPDPLSPTGQTITLVARGGNPDLQPEESTMWTAGIEWAPHESPFRASVNYYNVDYTDRIASASSNVLTPLIMESTLGSAIIRNPTAGQIDDFSNLGGLGLIIFRAGPFGVPAGLDEDDAGAIADLRLRNISSQVQEGVDLDFSFLHAMGRRDLELGLAGDYIFEREQRITDASPWFSVVGTIYNPPQFKLRGRAVLTGDRSTLAAFVNYTDSYVDNISAPARDVDSWTTVDLNVSYDLGADGETAVQLRAGVQNLFDKDPPFVSNIRGVGFDPTNASPWGRIISVGASVAW